MTTNEPCSCDRVNRYENGDGEWWACPLCSSYFQRVRQDEVDDIARLLTIRTAAAKVLEGFDKGIFVRSIEHDHLPSWSIDLFPYVAALQALKLASRK